MWKILFDATLTIYHIWGFFIEFFLFIFPVRMKRSEYIYTTLNFT